MVLGRGQLLAQRADQAGLLLAPRAARPPRSVSPGSSLPLGSDQSSYRGRCTRQTRPSRDHHAARGLDPLHSSLTSAPPGAKFTRRTSQSGAARLERGQHLAGLLPLAPEQHRRAGARDRGADGAQVARLVQQLDRARVQRRPPRLVQPVVQPAADQREVRPRQAQRQQRGVGDVERGLGHGHLGRQRGARLLGRHRRRRHGHDALQALGRLDPHRVAGAADHEAAVQRGGDVVGVALQLARVLVQRRVQLEHVVGRRQAGHDAGGAGAQARPTAGSPTGSRTTARRPGAASRTRARTGWCGPAARRACRR